MAEKSKNNKLVVIVIILLVLLLAAAGVVIVLLAKGGNDEPSAPIFTSETGIQYDIHATVLDGTSEVATSQGEGIAVKYRPSAYSSDGLNFDCQMGNSTGNKLDMYLSLYESDENLNEQEPIFLSGLLRPGEGITSFKTNKQMPEGDYDVVLAFTLVEDDHKTLHGQTLVYLTFRVHK